MAYSANRPGLIHAHTQLSRTSTPYNQLLCSGVACTKPKPCIPEVLTGSCRASGLLLPCDDSSLQVMEKLCANIGAACVRLLNQKSAGAKSPIPLETLPVPLVPLTLPEDPSCSLGIPVNYPVAGRPIPQFAPSSSAGAWLSLATHGYM